MTEHLIEQFSWILLGCALGTITGLAPGIHVNTVAVLVLAAAKTQDTNLALMVVSMATVHSFVDFIPSILLGAPEDDTFLSVLPGHHFLLKGKALHAIKLTIAGGIFSTIFSIIALPFFAVFVSGLNGFFSKAIPWILAGSIILMVATEKQKKYAALTITISAALGIILLRTTLISDPLFPLASGFFGASTMVYSLQKQNPVPEQKEEKFRTNTKSILRGSLISSLAAGIISIIPSTGPSQAAFLLKQFFGKISRTEYLIIIGGINTANYLFSFYYLFLTGRTRTGAAAAVKELMAPDEQALVLIIIAILISAGIGAIITEMLAKRAVKKIAGIDYNKLNKAVLALIFFLSFALSGIFGAITFISATATGLFALSCGVKRTTCMAFLMAPTILFYLHAGP